MGARHVHGGLVGLQGDQRRLEVDLVALGHRDLDHLDVAVAAEVGHGDLHGALAAAGLGRRRLGGGLRGLLGRRCGLLLGLVGRRRGVAAALDLEFDDVVTLGDGVALLHQHLDHLAALGRGHVHAGLVGFQRDQGVLGVDDVAFRHRDLDDLHIGIAADVRYFDDFATQGRAPSKSCLEGAGTGPPHRISRSADSAWPDRCCTSPAPRRSPCARARRARQAP